MSIILNIDTSSQQANVTLCRDGEVIGKVLNGNQHEHASFLQPAIKQLLEIHQTRVDRLDAIAVVNGPGSYTGLRVALASAKGLCYVLGKPLITINTLSLLARAAIVETAKTGLLVDLLCPMIDARRMEVFTAVFDLTLREVLPPQAILLTPDSFSATFDKHKILFFGSGAAKWKSLTKNANALFADTFDTLPAMALLSYEHFNAQQFADLAYSEPFYLKEFYTGK